MENIIQTVKHQHSAPALAPPQYNLNNLRREKRATSRQRRSRGVFSYYGNHSARGESEEDANSGEQRLSAGGAGIQTCSL